LKILCFQGWFRQGPEFLFAKITGFDPKNEQQQRVPLAAQGFASVGVRFTVTMSTASTLEPHAAADLYQQ
jgi:hypothetical protein